MARSLNRVKDILNKVKHIQKEADKKKEKEAAKYLTDRCNKISQREHERLNVIVDKQTGQLLSEPVCSYRYYSQLMQNYRNGIKALGFRHHAIKHHINTFLRKYGNKKEGLHKKLDPHLPIEKLRENIILLRANTVTGSDFRRDLLSLRIEHHAYYMFEPKSAIKDWIRDDDQKQLNKKLHTQILVNPEWVKTLARNLLTKTEPSTSDLCIGIALASGRRLTEIMKTASLKAVDDKTLLFSGQLKTKNRYLFEEISPYQIPSMIEAQIVVKALDKLRKKTQNDPLKYQNVFGEMIKSEVKKGAIKDYDHNKAVHKKYESTMNRAVRALFQNGQFSLKDCRALYTEVTYENHLKEGEARSAYRHRVLGHSLIETQLHYEAFRLDNSVQSIELAEKNNHEKITDLQKSLSAYLEKADNDVVSYARAPKMAVMHEWLKSEVINGLKLEKMTPSYIRRHCLFEGKQLNLNTIKKYLKDFIQLAQFC
ncbi:protelomerase family protein [Candidatus Williamhamiltonella defendens]